MINEKALKRAKGLQGRLKSGKGRPVEGPGSPGWQGMGNGEGITEGFGSGGLDGLGGLTEGEIAELNEMDLSSEGGPGDSGGSIDGGDPGTDAGDPSGGHLA